MTRNRSFFVILSTLSLILGVQSAQAQQAKILKVQGKKAIVQFPDDVKPSVGQTLDVGSSGGSHRHAASGRATIIGGSALFSTLTTSGASNSTTTLGADAKYGYNQEIMEFGGTVAFSYISSGTSATAFGFGGFFDYNLVPNKSGTEFVYGGTANASYNSVTPSTGSGASYLKIELGGQIKWFGLSDNVAVRGDAVYRYQNSSTTAYQVSGLVTTVGLYYYY